MGCNCSGGRRSAGSVTGYKVTTASGEEKGPFLTQTEARIALQRAGGGTIQPVRTTA